MKKRSASSKFTESIIKNRPQVSRTQEEFREHILSLGENDKVTAPIYIAEFEVDDFEGIKVYKYNRKKIPDQTIIFYVHGGEFVYNPLMSHFDSLHEIGRKTNSLVIMPIYHKLPKYKDNYPILLDLYKEVLNTHPASKIVLMGDSAGGGLALGLAQVLRDEGIKQPDQIILISPWLDLHTNQPMVEEVYLETDPLLEPWKLQMLGEMWAGGTDLSDPMVSPIFGNLKGLGRITAFVGTREIFFPDVIRLDKLLQDQGIIHDLIVGQEQNHVYVLYPITEGREAREMIVGMINQIDL